MSRRFLSLVILAVLCLAGCSQDPSGLKPLAEVYVGPMKLSLRKELEVDAPISGVATHGEKVQIIQTRRRFVKIRHPKGWEGWTDSRQLLSGQQMDELRRLSDLAKALPSHGEAKVFEALNVHTEPNRLSPSFYRINDAELVEVLAHKLSPRVAYQPSSPLIPPPPKPVRKEKPKRASSRLQPPPAPPGPALPPNWQELSTITPPPPFSPEELAAEAKRQEALRKANPVRLDDWTLVRVKDGRAGWVLTAPLQLAIPDEVAQYSEGNRITSYFALNTTNDDGLIKQNWLWTTMSEGGKEHQFDSFRVFSWRSSKDRYETTYIERRVLGYQPVKVHPVEIIENKKPRTVPGFTLILQDEEGQFTRQTFSYEGWRVRLLEKAPAERPPDPLSGMKTDGEEPVLTEDRGEGGSKPWYRRLQEKIEGVRHGAS